MAKYFNLLRTNIPYDQRFISILFVCVLVIICFFSVVYQIYFIPISLTALWFYLALDLKQKEFLFIIVALFPFSFGEIANIEDFTLVEMFAPLMLIILIIYQPKKPISLNGISRKYFFAMSILIFWNVFHYIKNPVSAGALSDTYIESVGLRSYYGIFVGIIIFCICFRYFYYEKINPDMILKLVLILSLLVGLLRIISYFFSFNIPLGGAFNYGMLEADFGEYSVHRIGGIDLSLHLGLSSLFGYYYRRKFNFLFVVILLSFFILAIFGGGRTIFVGMILCTIGYFVFIVKSKIFYLLIPFLATLFLFFSSIHSVKLPNQFNRLFALDAIFQLQNSSVYRGPVWNLYLRTFLKNPIFGKGIGPIEESMPNSPDDIFNEFVKSNIAFGGHNGYLSILAIFGIGGAIFLGIMLYGTIYSSFHYFRNYPLNKLSNIVLFIFFLSVLSAIYYFTGQAGYKETLLYLSAGTIAGIYCRKNN